MLGGLIQEFRIRPDGAIRPNHEIFSDSEICSDYVIVTKQLSMT